MKKIILALVCMVGLTAMAQREKGHGRDGMKDLTAEQIATLHTKKMTLALDLTSAQEQKIKAINLEDAKERKAKHEERKAQKEEGERKKLTSDERYAMQNAKLDKMIARKAEMKKILSAEQYEKWQTMHHQRGQKHSKKRKAERKSKK
ncbi:Spy/CpxP family protein refolding chaperone [Zobellia laminariae]|uniref:Spy/CpxP family protein refolding chaperone n=1 Tax=Zobellia laminariae TaxID=248906 RepID=UPI0026F4234C|nr:Spy/CpxP family protein refolding chaperone [Zobellia laminariae]WKX77375.1 Spy/CpxP family protein refolding chaperone [Zobellia laminariae]